MGFYDDEPGLEVPYERPVDRDADEELGYIFQPDWWPPSP
jgi:hypothetical protein